MQITTIPRTAVKSALDAMRLPLSTIERLTGQAENQAWPPALMFEEFQASAKQFAGSVLRDETLVEEGRLQSVKVSELRRSFDLDLKAEATREQADAKLARKHESAEGERQQAEQQAREREAKIARLKRDTEARVKADAKRAAETVAKAEKIREDRLAAADRAARLANADAESTALAKQKKAVASISKVTTLADAVETKKAKRKSN
ncbi:MAG: hypothetical protein H0U92_05965 [Actinobacteria bacterium]|nr:hypothetical protein [Actinomycetota bacterium]